MKDSLNNRKIKIMIIILILITAAAIGVTIWTLFFRGGSEPVLAPDYAPQEEEEYAEDIPGDEGGKLESPEGGGSVSLTYSTEVSIDLGKKKAALHFGNPGKSNQDMVLQIVIQDNVVVQSGTLKPGKQVDSLDLLADAEDKLVAGTYDGRLNILYYDQETGEKAIVNTEIPVTIEVSE